MGLIENFSNFLILFRIETFFYQKVAIGEKRRIYIIMATDILNNIVQTVAFHRITFAPSRGPSGSKLNVANTAL